MPQASQSEISFLMRLFQQDTFSTSYRIIFSSRKILHCLFLQDSVMQVHYHLQAILTGYGGRLVSLIKSVYSKVIIFCILFIAGCSFVDIGGLFYSSDVDSRFRKKNSLPGFTAPPLANGDNFKFIVISDTHYYKKQPGYLKKLEALRLALGFEFVVITGDIVQNGKESAYNLVKNDIGNLLVPVYPVIGNHDIYNNGFNIYKKVFGRSIYDFSLSDTYFIFLDTANGTLGPLQKNWLESSLKSSRQDNIFVFSHYSPTDKEFQSATAMPYPEESYYLYDLFDRYNVDYFFCGHLHHYERLNIRGVEYININAAHADNNSALLVSVNKTSITVRALSDIF